MELSVKLKGAKVLFLCSTDNMIWQFLIPHVKDLQKFGATVDCVCTKTGFWFDSLVKDHQFNMINVPMCRLPWKLKNYKAYKTLVQFVGFQGFSLYNLPLLLPPLPIAKVF